MNSETSIIPVGADEFIRELIGERKALPLGMLASTDLRTMRAVERQYWQRLQDAGLPLQWKAAIRLTFEADGNECVEFSFERWQLRLDKANCLWVKEDAAILYDDREPAREVALPGEWMIALQEHIAREKQRQEAIARRNEEGAQIAQIVRLKG